MKYLNNSKAQSTRIAFAYGETVTDNTTFPPLNEIMAVAMMFIGAILIFVS
jgi:hypothetical protein